MLWGYTLLYDLSKQKQVPTAAFTLFDIWAWKIYGNKILQYYGRTEWSLYATNEV